MRTIIVPLDGSELAERAIPYARLLAPLFDAKLRLLRIVPDSEIRKFLAHDSALPRGESPLPPHDREQHAAEVLRTDALNYLTPRAALLRSEGVTVDIDILRGHPAEQIVDEAAASADSLITIATHGYSGLRRWALGSVTDRVVAAASAPIFVIRSSAELPPHPIRRILVALDGSKLAEAALPFALELARRAEAEVLLLHVAEPPLDAVYGAQLIQYRAILDAICTQALADMTSLAATLRLDQPGPITPLVAAGLPAEAIVDEAVAHAADLIVMATHGYSGLRRWALGNVAVKVLHTTQTPLVLIPTAPRG